MLARASIAQSGSHCNSCHQEHSRGRIRPMETRDSGTTEWLSDAEQRTWRGLVQLILELQAEQESALVEAHGITEGEYGVLAMLSEAEDQRLRMCDLAGQL